MTCFQATWAYVSLNHKPTSTAPATVTKSETGWGIVEWLGKFADFQKSAKNQPLAFFKF
jgi:hypothetical protein